MQHPAQEPAASKYSRFASIQNGEKEMIVTPENTYVIQPVSTYIQKPHFNNDLVTQNDIAEFENKIKNGNFTSDAAIKPLDSNNIYHFSEWTTQYPLIPDVGVTANYEVKGWSKKSKDSIEVSIITRQYRHGLTMSGNVEVWQNGQLYSSKKLKYSPEGYFYKTGDKPLGEAKIKVPSVGKYDVKVNVFGVYNDGTGRNSINYSKNLPYGK